MLFDRDFIFNFLGGGLMIACCGYISKHYTSYLSGLLYGGMPFAAYYLYFYSIYINEGKKKDGEHFLNGCMIGGVIWILLVALLYPVHYNIISKI